ncbi:hypothetical protein BpHYR1_048474, partial [Brachionus plicatilis]
ITFDENLIFDSHLLYSYSSLKTNHSRLQVLQNISIKYSYNLPHDTPSDILINFLDDIKLDNIEVHLNKLFIKYLKNSVIFKNSLTIDLIKEYVSAFVNSSRQKHLYEMYGMNSVNVQNRAIRRIYKLRWDSPTRSLFSLLVEEYSGSWSENTAKVSVTSTTVGAFLFIIRISYACTVLICLSEMRTGLMTNVV